MTERVIKFKDSDTGESTMDVVRVPEGFSFQVSYIAGEGPDMNDMVSVILSPEQANDLRDFILESRP
jgi:hypothetical protein